MSVNKVILIGRAGKDPDVRTLDGGAKVASLSFATTAASTFLIEVLTADLIDLFLSAFFCFTKTLFLADLILA